jgi:hypothetical protein
LLEEAGTVNPIPLAVAAFITVAPVTGGPPPPDYCKQDSDWYLCQHHQEPPRTSPATAEADRADIRTADRATTVRSPSR